MAKYLIPPIDTTGGGGGGSTDVSALSLEATQLLVLAQLELIKSATETGQSSTNTKLDTIATNQDAQATAVGQTNIIAAINAPRRSYAYDVALGNVSGVTAVEIMGINAATPTTGEPIWRFSGTSLPIPATAQTLTISSSSGNDTAVGIGMRSATVKWIGFTTGAESTLVIALNGQTPVSITTNGYLPNFLEGASYGANGTNVGLISIGYGVVTAGVPANVLSQIAINENIALQSFYTVPAGKTLDLNRAYLSGSGACTLQIRETVFGAAGFRIRANAFSTGIEMLENDSVMSIVARNTVYGFAMSNGGSIITSALLKGFLR